MKILHLTSILPAPLSTKKYENDILLRLAKEYEMKHPGTKHSFIYIVPFSNKLLSLLKNKWEEYRSILKMGTFHLDGYQVIVIGVPGFKNDAILKSKLTLLGYYLNHKRIKEVLVEIKPDLIHAHNLGSNIELAEIIRRSYSVPYVVTARNPEQIPLKRIRNSILRPKCIISHNRIFAEKCNQVGVPIHLVPHPVDGVFFFRDKQKNQDSRCLKLVTVCNLIRRKNIDKVISVLKEIGGNFLYTVYGDGSEKAKLIDQVKLLNLQDKVSFKGYVPFNRIPQVLSENDLFVMPSYNETLGRAYFEAMAMGIPVIASKNTGIDKMIEHRVHGYLVDPVSKTELKDAILHYLNLDNSKRMIMSDNAMMFAKQFTWEAILNEYYKIYNC